MKILHLLLLAAASLTLASCLEVKSVVSINKDGTATLEETALVSAQLKAMMDSGGAQGGGADAMKSLVPDKAKAEERAKKLGDGVTVTSHEEVKMPDGRAGVKVTYAVADIRKLKYTPFGDQSKDSGGEDPLTFALDGSTLTMTLPGDKKPEKKDAPKKPDIPKEQMMAQMAMMKPMFAGMRMTAEIKAAGGIASTDATHHEGDTVTILDMQIDKLMDKPESFMNFMESAENNLSMAEASAKFKDVDGIKIEGKNAVKVELK